MKKLLGIALTALTLAACSHHDRPEPMQGPMEQDAMVQGDMNQTAMPQQGQQMPPRQGANPQVEEALKSCQQSVGSKPDQAKLDACMKEKGFVRPTQQPAPQTAPVQK
ncbi:hypothetical protein CBG46_04195 [Actinobacillus succinogenes]|uniref:Lipoprotein n=1 Tax=Actinobacillus succinogenes (strain ATCC 55618 / DSM 22257 / CCUG 43843 / 130Z) TaxID=339671 RepID=A6VKW6_ACTSZ|nr:hypothetical protein [Actinobacillus succinogenes]ABR73613.1 conserved hypothetical protein [Actinobacillus succinogenes 130Z]PHI39927.1 hypothetical protein CBG46_04195 [Actinobacillus succinogenes]